MNTLLFTDPPLLGGGSGAWEWAALAFLGAWHGINPAMGWLFAAALGLQEKRGGAAWWALPPLALGHALAVAAALAIGLLLGIAVSPEVVRWVVAGALVSYGGYRLVRRSHPRFGGMRVGPRDLTIWSFLMASVHGAGLMVLPFVLGEPDSGEGRAASVHGAHLSHGRHPGSAVEGPSADVEVLGATVLPSDLGDALSAILVHTASYLVVTGLLAALVVHWWGLRLLRSLWIDLDRLWAGALILTGLLTLAL